MSGDNISFHFELDHYKNKQKLQQVYLRVTQNRKHNRIKMGVFIKSEQFDKDGKNGIWIKKHPDAGLYNDLLQKKLKQAKNTWTEKQTSNSFVNKEVIAENLKRGDDAKDFFLFWDKKVQQMLKYGTSSGYNTTKNKHVFPFFQNLGYATVDFRQITPSILTDLENTLAKKGLDDDSIYTVLKRVRAIFNKAISEELIEPNIYPFRGYKMPKVTPNKKERLNDVEVKLFENLKLDPGSLIFNVQQSWLLSFNCAGIRVEDLLTLKMRNIVNGRLIYQMDKTGKIKSIQISPRIKGILNNYISEKSKPEDYIFPFAPKELDDLDPNSKEYKTIISAKTSLLNKYLKKIAKKAGIKKNITNHTSRHSFANVARKKKADVHAIKNALGHSSIKITEGYLDSFDEEDLDAMMDKVTS